MRRREKLALITTLRICPVLSEKVLQLLVVGNQTFSFGSDVFQRTDAGEAVLLQALHQRSDRDKPLAPGNAAEIAAVHAAIRVRGVGKQRVLEVDVADVLLQRLIKGKGILAAGEHIGGVEHQPQTRDGFQHAAAVLHGAERDVTAGRILDADRDAEAARFRHRLVEEADHARFSRRSLFRVRGHPFVLGHRNQHQLAAAEFPGGMQMLFDESADQARGERPHGHGGDQAVQGETMVFQRGFEPFLAVQRDLGLHQIQSAEPVTARHLAELLHPQRAPKHFSDQRESQHRQRKLAIINRMLRSFGGADMRGAGEDLRHQIALAAVLVDDETRREQ